MNVFGKRTPDARNVQGWSVTLDVGKSIFDYYDSLGDVMINTPTQIPSAVDGPTVVRRYKNLTVSALLTTQYRCRGLMLLVDGNLTINSGGQISMTARGARGHAGMGLYDGLIPDSIKIESDKIRKNDVIQYLRETGYSISDRWMWDEWAKLMGVKATSWDGGTVLLSATGCGATNNANILTNTGGYQGGVVGNAGVSGGCGGGGTGGGIGPASIYVRSGAGGRGCPWGGGAGGAGSQSSGGVMWTDRNVNADGYGGCGGEGPAHADVSNTFGGGAGNPGGRGGAIANNGQDGTGGVLYIIVKGNIVINSGGIIDCDGKNGGTVTSYYCGGGGSGGGHVSLVYGGTYTNNGTVRANGGSGGVAPTSGANGGAGGAGSVVAKTFSHMGWN